MPLESATYVADLNSSNPATTDAVGQGDDHLRLIKSALKATFANFTSAALSSTQAAIDAAVTFVSGVIKVAADGTVTAPAYSWASETNSGWYRAGSNSFRFSLAGTDVLKLSGAGFDIITAGALLAGGSAIFPLQAANIGASQVTTAKVADNNVTLAKLAQSAAAKVVLGASTTPANYAELGMGTGMDISGGNLVCTVVDHPPTGTVRGLAIDNDGVAPTTKINITADAVSLLDGSNTNPQQAYSVSTSVDLTTTGAGGCDVGTRAASKGYYIWLIGDGTNISAVASLDTNSSPTMPGIYTRRKLVAWVRTDGSSNLYRISTRGAKSKYKVVTGSTTTGLPLAVSGANGSSGGVGSPVYSSVSLSGLIPPNSTEVGLVYASSYNGGGPGQLQLAPSTSHGSASSGTNPPLILSNANAGQVSFVLEALSFGWWTASSGAAGCAALVHEWVMPI